MRSRFTLTTVAALALCLPLAAQAQRVQKAQGRFPPGPCHTNTRLCIQQMNSQISKIRAYAAHLKPGETVEFNPQPDPPGIPPIFRNARQAFRSLQAEIADLSSNSSEIAGLKGSPERLNSAQGAISDAQDKLSKLGQSSDRASLGAALNSLSASVRRLSDSLATPQFRR